MSNTFRIGLAVIALSIFSPALATKPSTQYYPRPGKPFSSAVRIGDNVYVAGSTGAASDGSMPKDFTTQATNTMDAVGKNLKLAGASMDDVYKCTIALTNMDDWDSFNVVYLKYFKAGQYPVRMSFGVTSLGGAAVEVQCEAHIKS
jgi:2-iminobutanoate/2-iminopropanoate deaminase